MWHVTQNIFFCICYYPGTLSESLFPVCMISPPFFGHNQIVWLSFHISTIKGGWLFWLCRRPECYRQITDKDLWQLSHLVHSLFTDKDTKHFFSFTDPATFLPFTMDSGSVLREHWTSWTHWSTSNTSNTWPGRNRQTGPTAGNNKISKCHIIFKEN